MSAAVIEAATVDDVLAAVRRAIGVKPGHPFVALHEPEFRGKEWEYVKDCIDTGWVSSAGKYVGEFERRLADFTGAKHCVAIVNGTAALHLALLLAGVGENDEVIIPTLSFVATANAVAYCGAVPHFADSAINTLGMDPQKLALWLEKTAEHRDGRCVNRLTGRRIAAIVPMHTFGHPVDLDPLLELANHWRVPVVEDATESLGSRYKGRYCGTFSTLGVLSFNGNKIVTTGGGGAILTDDPEIARRAKHLSTTAKRSHPWRFDHDEIGFNYRLPNINAALGCAQLENLAAFVERKRALALAYREAFALLKGVEVFAEPGFARSNYWLNVILVAPEMRDRLLTEANQHGLMARPAWTLLHRLPMYEEAPRMADLSAAEELESRLVNLPSSARLGPRA